MIYLATVKDEYTTYTRMFTLMKDAEQWCDENNNNGTLTTIIDTYDDQWHKIDGFFYTEAK